MPTFDEYMAMLQPNQEQARKQAMWQALSGLGAGLLGGRNWQQGLSRGGLLAYDAMQGSQDRAAQDAMVALKQRMMAQELADKDSAKEQAAKDQQQLGSIFAGGPNLAAMGPGGPTPANAAAVKPPSQVEQYRKAAAFYAARGNVEGAKKLADIADAIEGTYSTSPQVSIGPDGKPVYAQFSNKGGYRAAEGIAPPPDMALVDTGGAKTFVDKLTTKPGTSFAMTMDPAQKDASARGWAGLGLEREKFGYQQGKDAADQQNALKDGSAKFVESIRKEYNALQPVQNYRAAAPLLESAKNAPDTPAGDLDIIYAVGKSLDPNSVVREGELNLVIKAGSPAERLAGIANYIKGGGRLSPSQRQNFMAMLGNRVGQLKVAHDAAAAPYIKQATALGLPMDQVFQADSVPSAGGPKAGTIVDGYRFKGGDPNDKANWERQ